MPFVQIREGYLTKCATELAVGSRCAVLPTGELLCSCMLTSALATNDFLPVLHRSDDLGDSWRAQGPIWPHLAKGWSLFVSLSRAADGGLFLFGTRTPIGQPGESFWSDATQGLKQNELIYARSLDGGYTWTDPAVIPMPIPGSAEAPGAFCVSRSGAWLGPYTPYNTFDPALVVERNQVVVVRSTDEGRTWTHSSMLRFADAGSGAAEAWVVELSDGRLLGTCWHLRHGPGGDYPNAFALSHDDGLSWGTTRSTGILGQSTALAALPDGRAMFIYNQRRHGEIGVWLAIVKPTDTDFGVQSNEILWRAPRPTQSGSSGEHAEWGDFSFGEPSITPLPDSTLLVTLWCVEASGGAIRYVKVKASGAA